MIAEEERDNINRELSKMEFLAKLLGSDWKASYVGSTRVRNGPTGGVGGHCKGSSVEECRKQFGDQLHVVCSKCPD